MLLKFSLSFSSGNRSLKGEKLQNVLCLLQQKEKGTTNHSLLNTESEDC